MALQQNTHLGLDVNGMTDRVVEQQHEMGHVLQDNGTYDMETENQEKNMTL